MTVRAKRELGFVDAKDKGITGHQRLENSALSQTALGQPGNEIIVADHVHNLSRLSGTQQLQRNNVTHVAPLIDIEYQSQRYLSSFANESKTNSRDPERKPAIWAKEQ